MGMIAGLLDLLFGGGRNAVRETIEVFRPNAEAESARSADFQSAALDQYGREFYARKGWFDRLMDAINRVPRPALALGTLGLFVAAMVDPVWFAQRMQGIALVPEPMWWLLGVIVSFYFGARQQMKSQDFQREIAATVARAPEVIGNIKQLREIQEASPGAADTGSDATLALSALGSGATSSTRKDGNAALADWNARKGR
jgi:holin (3TMs family)